ncbi:SWIB/MDM2 domain protein [Indivirus ILV1]|uniref:SWIB/MDM2 domain protein n=1 Tax=Indivirus ILV1 TaxID=1977633 RepID=A0A1V0SDA2_9VIRU|nr:SWIB/MDM2 domain protein [Indivirus ILV1]
MTELQKLTASLNFTCSYYDHKCRDIPQMIDEFHKNGHKLTSEFTLAYLQKLVGINGNSSCIYQNSDWVGSIIKIYSYLVPKREEMILLITGYNGSVYASNKNLNENSTILWKSIVKSIKEIPVDIFEYGIRVRNFYVLSLIVDFTKGTSKCIEDLCKHGTKNDTLILNIIDKLFLQKITITLTALNNAVKSGLIDIAISFVQKGIHPDNTTLVSACRLRDERLIKILLACNLTPTKECFESLIYYHPSSSEANKIASIIDLLIQCGYKITYNDIIFSLEKRQYVNNISSFDIKFDNKIIEKCASLSYYPYSEKDIKVKPTIECLRIECQKPGNIKNIKMLINSGLKPDIQCLRNACSVKNNTQGIRLLVDKYGLKIDLECLKLMASAIGNKQLSYMLENIDLQQESNKDVSKIKKVEFSDEEINNESEEINNEINIGINKKDIDEIAKPINGDCQKAEELKKHISSDKKPDIPSNKSIDVHKIQPLSENEIKLIDHRKKYGLLPEGIQIFNVKKTTKMTVIEIRNLLTKYIVDNNLIDKNNKAYINLNDDLIKILKTEKNKCIEFIDLDNLVNKLIKF